MTRVQRWIVTGAAATFLALVVFGVAVSYLGARSQHEDEQRQEQQDRAHIAEVRRTCETRARAVMDFDRTHPGSYVRTYDGEVAKCMAANL